MKTDKRQRSLRVIGGEHRSRKISFAADEAIRPTPDRIRETLFNWLRDQIAGAECLELYAGSGILSIESLSRGAQHATIIEKSAEAALQIKQNLTTLKIAESRFSCIAAVAYDWLSQNLMRGWDLIFLDPPFDSDELGRILLLISAHNLLNDDGFLYIESPREIIPADLGPSWKIHRAKRAASVHYCICVRIKN